MIWRTNDEKEADLAAMADEYGRMLEEQRRVTDEKTARLRAELEALKSAAAATGGDRNVRGSVTKALMPRIDIIREATLLGTPITQQQQMLERSGIKVSYNSLRKFIQKYLRAEYEAFLANSRTTGVPPQKILDSPTSPEEELEIFGDKAEKNEGESQPSNNLKPAPLEKVKKAENLSDLQRISRTDVDTSEYE